MTETVAHTETVTSFEYKNKVYSPFSFGLNKPFTGIQILALKNVIDNYTNPYYLTSNWDNLRHAGIEKKYFQKLIENLRKETTPTSTSR